MSECKKCEVGIDWGQPSTIRGIVWAVGGIAALLMLIFGSVEKAVGVMTIAGTVAGGLGVGIKDNG